MGSLLSVIIANMVMEEIEQTAIKTYLKPPSLWVRYVDDVCSIVEKTEVESFHDYLNTISTSITFTKELEKSGQLAFLDVSVQQLKDGSLATSVYRKPTHTDRYLQYCSHYPVNQNVTKFQCILGILVFSRRFLFFFFIARLRELLTVFFSVSRDVLAFSGNLSQYTHGKFSILSKL